MVIDRGETTNHTGLHTMDRPQVVGPRTAQIHGVCTISMVNTAYGLTLGLEQFLTGTSKVLKSK